MDTVTGASFDERAAQLAADRDHAREQLERLEAEYAMMLNDAGAIQEDRDNVRALLEAARQTFAEAEAAIEQFNAGTYGICARCGGPIGAERLEALPGATMCVACQSHG